MSRIDLRWSELYANPDPGIYKGFSLFEFEKVVKPRGWIRIAFKKGINTISVIGESEEKVMRLIFDLIDRVQEDPILELIAPLPKARAN